MPKVNSLSQTPASTTPPFTVSTWHLLCKLSFLMDQLNEFFRAAVILAPLGSLPFAFSYIFERLALPKGYTGIRNEQLLPKDQQGFDLWRFREYELLKEEDDFIR
ncbi:hypothetical protein DM02DRAFT_611902 [Periconia macrospinosa]|uniref:Uncharacterized protein n=1 Tax=Periconia macrospinosa TaxID=97972 RepID=A0A2V1E1D4_9PLEO|nr:hypothetical protein DM02DRAFT_611902 [Periconia macrospinosa]